jgi:tetratricopeptide (TPR) repeat protein/DNA-binding CsgD family transcriptional regulator
MDRLKKIDGIRHVGISVLETRLQRAVRPKDRLWAMLRLAEELTRNESAQVERGLALFTAAERLAKEIVDRRGLVAATRGMGNCQLRLSNHTAALEILERALPIAEQTGDAESEILILQDIGTIYRRQSHHDLALKTLAKCTELSELIGNAKMQSSTLNQMGILYRNLGRYHESLECHTKSLALLHGAGLMGDQAVTLQNMSYALKYLGRYAEALSTLGQARDLCRAEKNPTVEGYCQICIGMIYSEFGDYPAALSAFYTSAKIMERIGDKLNLANAYGNLTHIYLQLGNTEQATSFGDKALSVFEDIGDMRGQAAMLGILGQHYLNREEKTQARQLLHRCLILSRKIGSKDHEVDTLTVIAKEKTRAGKFTTAEKLFRRALSIANESGNPNLIITALLELGSLFNKRGVPDKAIPFLEHALIVNKTIHSRRFEQEAHQILVEALESKGDLKRALTHSKLASNIKEEILGSEKQKAITQLLIRAEIEKSEHETELLRKEKDQQKKELEIKSQEFERKTVELAEKTEAIRKINRRVKEIVKPLGREEGAEGGTLHAVNILLSEFDCDHARRETEIIFNREFQITHQGIVHKLSQGYPTLTITERKICVLLAEGLSIKDTAAMLKISPRTVQWHHLGILKKMKLKPRTRLASVLMKM